MVSLMRCRSLAPSPNIVLSITQILYSPLLRFIKHFVHGGLNINQASLPGDVFFGVPAAAAERLPTFQPHTLESVSTRCFPQRCVLLLLMAWPSWVSPWTRATASSSSGTSGIDDVIWRQVKILPGRWKHNTTGPPVLKGIVGDFKAYAGIV